MPYIKQNERQLLDSWVDQLKPHITTPGELNYVISRLIEPNQINYANINEIIGVLECAKMEAYRRLSKYEDMKIAENGDIWYEKVRVSSR